MFRHSRAALAAAVFLAGGSTQMALAEPDLANAVASHNAHKIDKLLASGAPVDEADAQGRTALFLAASQADQPLMQRLLDKGAAVNAPDATGATPLMAAVRSPVVQWASVQFLLDKGANINAADKTGHTPLMEAVLRAPDVLDTDGQVAMVTALLAAGADPAHADASGATAMHHAAYVGEPRKVLEILLAASKAPDATTVSGANVLMMAAQNHQRANFDFLLAKGFRPVRIHAVGADHPALAQDMSPRANAFAEDWWGQYANRKGQPEASRAAFAAAAQDYADAAAEARRLCGLYEIEVAKDQKARNEARAAILVADVLTSALTMGAGTGYMVAYMPGGFKTKLEEDQRALDLLKAEADETSARATALRTLIAAN